MSRAALRRLFGEVALRFEGRRGGYLRLTKVGLGAVTPRRSRSSSWCRSAAPGPPLALFLQAPDASALVSPQASPLTDKHIAEAATAERRPRLASKLPTVDHSGAATAVGSRGTATTVDSPGALSCYRGQRIRLQDATVADQRRGMCCLLLRLVAFS